MPSSWSRTAGSGVAVAFGVAVALGVGVSAPAVSEGDPVGRAGVLPQAATETASIAKTSANFVKRVARWIEFAVFRIRDVWRGVTLEFTSSNSWSSEIPVDLPAAQRI